MNVTRTLTKYHYLIRIYIDSELEDVEVESFVDLSEKQLDKSIMKEYGTHLLSVVEKTEHTYKCTLDAQIFFELSSHEEIKKQRGDF